MIEVRDDIRVKNKTIEELKKVVSKLCSELVEKEVVEQSIINSFLKL